MSFVFLGLLFDLSSGLWHGLLVGVVVLLLLSKWGEKVILILAKARYVTDDEILINQVKNFCCHLNIPEVKIYWSNVFINNVYFTNSYFGKPALIIGKNVYQHFSRNELNSLIHASLLRIKSKEAENRTMVTLMFFILYSPVHFFKSLFKSLKIRKAIDVFFYPLHAVKALMYEDESLIMNFDKEVAQMHGLKKDYISALFKVAHLPAFGERNSGALVLSELSHVRNMSGDVFNNILVKSFDIKKRIKALSAN